MIFKLSLRYDGGNNADPFMGVKNEKPLCFGLEECLRTMSKEAGGNLQGCDKSISISLSLRL